MTGYLLRTAVVFGVANGYGLAKMTGWPNVVWIGLAALFLLLQGKPSLKAGRVQKRRLRICLDGCILLRTFLASSGCSIVFCLAGFFGVTAPGSLLEQPKFWLFHTGIAVCVESVVFWNGMIRIYLTSEQLGIRWRLLGLLCGMIPVANLIVLAVLIRTAEREVAFETEKIRRNREREADRICATRYPILLVHGVFFRDFRYLNYWGRIPKELEKNGAVLYYGRQQSAASVADCGEELAARIREIVRECGCEKVNIIAHSKGGLDSRYALAKCGIADMVASLTTINTPHRGCEFADYLLSGIPRGQQEIVAKAYNAALRRLGEENPDFFAAVNDLTAGACGARNEEIRDVPGVYYQSIGTTLERAVKGRFPLNFSWYLVNHFDGENDGLVGERSFPWGEHYRRITPKGRRGISHGDMIDLNRENFDGFDVREFYVELVHELKERGL